MVDQLAHVIQSLQSEAISLEQENHIQELTDLESNISKQTTDIKVMKNKLTCVDFEAPLEHDDAFCRIKGCSCLFRSERYVIIIYVCCCLLSNVLCANTFDSPAIQSFSFEIFKNISIGSFPK